MNERYFLMMMKMMISNQIRMNFSLLPLIDQRNGVYGGDSAKFRVQRHTDQLTQMSEQIDQLSAKDVPLSEYEQAWDELQRLCSVAPEIAAYRSITKYQKHEFPV
jgi:hypothetical protein